MALRMKKKQSRSADNWRTNADQRSERFLRDHERRMRKVDEALDAVRNGKRDQGKPLAPG